MPEWLKGAGCKPVGFAYVGSNPTLSTVLSLGKRFEKAGVAQLARVSAFQAEGYGFETRLPLCLENLSGRVKMSPCGSVVEHTLGKGEVAGSILAMGSTFGMVCIEV